MTHQISESPLNHRLWLSESPAWSPSKRKYKRSSWLALSWWNVSWLMTFKYISFQQNALWLDLYMWHFMSFCCQFCELPLNFLECQAFWVLKVHIPQADMKLKVCSWDSAIIWGVLKEDSWLNNKLFPLMQLPPCFVMKWKTLFLSKWIK